MVTQAEVIYVDEVNKLCAAKDEGADGAQAKADGREEAGPSKPRDQGPDPRQGDGEGDGEGRDPFFDPLLNMPPGMAEFQRKQQEKAATWGPHGLMIIIPLRLGLECVNPIYFPGIPRPIALPPHACFLSVDAGVQVSGRLCRSRRRSGLSAGSRTTPFTLSVSRARSWSGWTRTTPSRRRRYCTHMVQAGLGCPDPLR
jgi:hypothetical protein